MQAPPTVLVRGLKDLSIVAGSPLIPPSYLTAYFLAFTSVLIVFYIYLYRKRKPQMRWHKIRLFIVTTALLKITAIGGGTIVAAYWLLPQPTIRRTIPAASSTSFATTNQLEVVFDRPVNRKMLEKSISPETPGRWVFEDSLYTTHLYRRLVFYPSTSFKSDTEYTVTLSNIQNFISISEPFSYTYKFKTQKAPQVKTVTPNNTEENVDINSEILVKLTAANDNVSEFDFQFDPPVVYEARLNEAKDEYTIRPKDQLRQGVEYTLEIAKSDVIWNLDEATILERSPSVDAYRGSFKTKEAPGITAFEPTGNVVQKNSSIHMSFSQEMDRQSVQENFLITPEVEGQFRWTDDKTLHFDASPLKEDTEYRVTIKNGAKSTAGFLEGDIVKTFKTIGPVRITHTSPTAKQAGLNIHTPISITFDQEVNHTSAESKFSLSPTSQGSFSWKGNTMTFTPSSPLSYSTEYTIRLSSNIQTVSGQNSVESYTITFTTQNSQVKLAVPIYLQKYTLSCEIASLRMALNYRGANVSEDEIIPHVGQDPTQKNGDIWGDPNKAFVGNIAGTQMVNGYGVHWAPIAKAARNYRPAQDFQGWNISQLTHELKSGNPVVIWVYSHFGTKTSWKTPDGANIYAVRDEHAVTAVGFVGPESDPTQLIINDPLTGQEYWSRASFDRKWGIFGNSGVVVY